MGTLFLEYQGRSYVEAEEAVVSPVFAGLMNIMIKKRFLVPRLVLSHGGFGSARPFRLSFPASRSIFRRVQIAICTPVCMRALPCWKSVPKCTRIDLRAFKIQKFPGGAFP